MAGRPRWYDNVPLTLGIGVAAAKIIPLLAIAGGSYFLVTPLMLVIRMDPLPWWLAQSARRAAQLGPNPSGFEMLVFAVVLIAVTAAQWYVVGLFVRNWLRARGH